jgi:peptide/nickel transport system permease protein
MKWGYKVILFFVIVAMLAPLISNNRPLVIISKGQITFPVFSEGSFTVGEDDFKIMPLIPYRAGVSDFDNADFKSPFDTQHVKNNSLLYRHWLGTTLRGCDVLAGIISGARYALVVGFFAALISLIIGLILGAASAFSISGWMRISFMQLITLFPLLLFDFNLFLNVQSPLLTKLLFFILSVLLWTMTSRIKIKHDRIIKLNFERAESQLTILFSSIPRLFFVVAVMGVFHQGILTLIVLLGLTGWMEIARLVRAEIHRIQSIDYYAAAKLSGASWMRITTKQILPNLKPLLIAVFAFSFAGAILSEASLSFLGFGLDANQVTWGSLILEGKESFNAWWLIVFPGICLSGCLSALFSIARNGNNEIYSL